jgi:hypothetical protein
MFCSEQLSHRIYIVRAEKKQCLGFVYAQGSGGEF